jgi:STE24 endopeptidase
MAKNRIKYPYSFDAKKRRLTKYYTQGRLISFLVQGIIIPFAFFGLLILSGTGAALANALPFVWYIQVPLFFTILYVVLNLIYLPTNFYFSYIYEHKYGLSNYTKRLWIKDHLKFSLFGYITSVPVITGLYFLLPMANWWVFAAADYFVLEVVFNYVFPEIFIPFFYKLSPYKDRAHMKQMLAIAKRAGVSNVNKVLVADESVRSKKANAFFAGFGRTKQIVLFDTLINAFTKDETETVLAHEAGHYVHKDIWKDIAADALKVTASLIIIDVLFNSLQLPISSVVWLPLIFVFWKAIDLATMPLMNAFSRRMERQADEFALDVVKKPEAQISTEKRLADMHLSELKSHWLVEKWLYSHPSVTDRIQLCVDWKKARK